MNETQLCGGCGKPVPPAQGRQAGLTWWCDEEVCQRRKRHRRYAATLAARGLPAPRPTQTCTRCGGEFRPQADGPVISGLCSRGSCRRERNARDALVRQRAMSRLAREFPERMAVLVADEVASLPPVRRVGEAA